MEERLRAFQEALLSSDRLSAQRVMEQERQEYGSMAFVDQVVLGALENIGSGWERGDYALSQVYMSGKICEELLEKLLPRGEHETRTSPRMALAVLEDQHVLGKRIVHSVLWAAGYRVADYGVVSAEELGSRAMDDGLEVLLISVLMLPSALRIREVKEDLRRQRAETALVVGGAPFRLDRGLGKAVGADAVGYTATDALAIVRGYAKGETA